MSHLVACLFAIAKAPRAAVLCRKSGVLRKFVGFRCLRQPAPTMASIYRRPDSQNFCLSCYPRPGSKLVRASLGTTDESHAVKVAQKVDLLIELEKMSGIEVPNNVLAAFQGMKEMVESLFTSSVASEQDAALPHTAAAERKPRCPIDNVLRSYLVRSMVKNVSHATSDKISRLRQFFGSARINSLDPRPPEVIKRRKKKIPMVEPWFKGDDLAEITTDTLLLFFAQKTYSRSSKRHFREIFHDIFRYALKSGAYIPDNPYAANPADDLPSFKGTGEPVTVLADAQVNEEYAAVACQPVVLFGCQLMIEAGFRLHEILALRRSDLDAGGRIRLILPGVAQRSTTQLKTGERTVTIRPVLRPMIQRFLGNVPGQGSDWCFPSSSGGRMTSDAFGESLRQINRAAGLPWTTQDFRHTFATNRINEGWNLKVIAQEMGTSVQMLMEHYAGYIEPPVLSSAKAIQDS